MAIFEEAVRAYAATGEPQLFAHADAVDAVPPAARWRALLPPRLRKTTGSELAVEKQGSFRTLPTRRATAAVERDGAYLYSTDRRGIPNTIPMVDEGFDRKVTHLYGGGGSYTEMHTDYEQRGFAVIAVMLGAKTVTWAPPDAPLERDRYYHDFPPGVTTVTLRPGEGAVMPAGWWHQVVNPEPTLAMVNVWDLDRAGTRRAFESIVA